MEDHTWNIRIQYKILDLAGLILGIIIELKISKTKCHEKTFD